MDSLGQSVGVFGVLALLGAVLYILRSKGLVQFASRGAGFSAERKLQALERLALTTNHSLHLVQVSGKLVLIAVSPGGCSVLDGGWSGSEHIEGRSR